MSINFSGKQKSINRKLKENKRNIDKNLIYNLKLVMDHILKRDFLMLINYYKKNNNFFKSMVKGKPNRDKFKYVGTICNSLMYVKIAEGRYGFNKVEKKNKSIVDKFGGNCKFMSNFLIENINFPINKFVGLIWRKYSIIPNAFPYLKNHFLLMSLDYDCVNDSKHGSQLIMHTDKRVIGDILDFYDLIDQKGFMFFNGFIGNSLKHFHCHYTTEKSILSKTIKDIKKFNTENFKTKNGSIVTILKSEKCPCYNGTFFIGKKEQVIEDVYYFLNKISKHFFYNIVFLPHNKLFQVLIHVRNKIKNFDETIIPSNPGANVGEYVVNSISKEEYNNKTLEKKLIKYCKLSYVNSKKQYFQL